MYITVESCCARKQGLQGSEVMSYRFYGEAVTVTAVTNTGYYKLDDGTYIHSDYLSRTKPAETTAATAPPPQSSASSSTAGSSQPAGVSDNITDQPTGCNAQEAEVFRLVNEIRKQYGLKPLKWDSNAYAAAKARCEEIMTDFSHTRNGKSFDTVYPSAILDTLRHTGENIGSGYSTAAKVVDAWMNSQLHRANILNPDFDNLAVAFSTCSDAYCYYWVQEFTTYKS